MGRSDTAMQEVCDDLKCCCMSGMDYGIKRKSLPSLSFAVFVLLHDSLKERIFIH
jgi:hypothetical protein